MRITILLHSTTGNTRVVTRFAAACLRDRGHDVDVVDVVRRPDLPGLDEVDLLGVASPTTYFRPTWTMERTIARMPNATARKPAFLINTCGGAPGAQFALLAELLAHKGYVALGAHWVLAPSNWPPHIDAMRPLAWSSPLARLAPLAPRSLRPLWAVFWERSGMPDRRDRDDLVRFLDEVTSRAAAGRLDDAPTPKQLHVAIPTTNLVGRIIPREFPDRFLAFHIDAGRCARCGTCVEVCSERIITRSSDEEVPRIGSGCYACFNRCPEGAISDAVTKPGRGQYSGPPRAMRDLFRW
jgi:ferredoxin